MSFTSSSPRFLLALRVPATCADKVSFFVAVQAVDPLRRGRIRSSLRRCLLPRANLEHVQRTTHEVHFLAAPCLHTRVVQVFMALDSAAHQLPSQLPAR